jgi:hypothetical protein
MSKHDLKIPSSNTEKSFLFPLNLSTRSKSLKLEENIPTAFELGSFCRLAVSRSIYMSHRKRLPGLPEVSDVDANFIN